MKRSIMALALIGTAVCVPALAQVGVSVSVGQPGFYGRLDIGDFPPPALIYSQPVTVIPAPPGRPPLYLRVPPGHAKHWRRYCGQYRACGEPVYFVTDGWYQREYIPRYQERHGGRGFERGHERGDGYGYGGGYRDEDRRDGREERGQGPGRGHGHGHGRD